MPPTSPPSTPPEARPDLDIRAHQSETYKHETERDVKWHWWPDVAVLAVFSYLTIMTGLALTVSRRFFFTDGTYVTVWIILAIALAATGATRFRRR
jgi:hypothetical protein